MKRLLILLALVVVSCSPTPSVDTGPSNNKDIRVDRLFDKDGCTIYRFEADGHYHYYAVCGGARAQTMTDYSYYVSTGKSGYTVYVNENIQTVTP